MQEMVEAERKYAHVVSLVVFLSFCLTLSLHASVSSQPQSLSSPPEGRVVWLHDNTSVTSFTTTSHHPGEGTHGSVRGPFCFTLAGVCLSVRLCVCLWAPEG